MREEDGGRVWRFLERRVRIRCLGGCYGENNRNRDSIGTHIKFFRQSADNCDIIIITLSENATEGQVSYHGG